MSRASRGFTLVEMLVVVVIMGVLASTVVIGFSGRDREQKLQTEAQRLALLIEMARTQAIQRNEEWGLAIGTASYRFFVFEARRGLWTEQTTAPFLAREVADMTFDVHVDALTIPGAKAAKDTPSIIIFSSGEQTPFEVEITPAWQAEPWQVTSDGLARTSAKRRA